MNIEVIATRLNQEHRDRIKVLCEALESDRYAQTTAALRNGRGYCCMGVACDVKDPVSWTSPAVPNRDQGDYFEYLGASGYMPERVADWYGWFEMDNPVVIDDNGELHTLSQLNDIEHYTFKQIAAALRRTYLVDTGSQDG